MSPRRRRVEKARPLAPLSRSEMMLAGSKVLDRAAWDSSKHHWPAPGNPRMTPRSFWLYEAGIPAELRPDRAPDVPVDGLEAAIRARRIQRERQGAWLMENTGGDWRRWLSR